MLKLPFIFLQPSAFGHETKLVVEKKSLNGSFVSNFSQMQAPEADSIWQCWNPKVLQDYSSIIASRKKVREKQTGSQTSKASPCNLLAGSGRFHFGFRQLPEKLAFRAPRFNLETTVLLLSPNVWHVARMAPKTDT